MTVSERLIKILAEDCIQITGSPVPLIFFNKLTADIYRYMAEVSIPTEKIKYIELAEKTYSRARMYYKMLTELRVSQTKTEGDG